MAPDPAPVPARVEMCGPSEPDWFLVVERRPDGTYLQPDGTFAAAWPDARKLARRPPPLGTIQELTVALPPGEYVARLALGPREPPTLALALALPVAAPSSPRPGTVTVTVELPRP